MEILWKRTVSVEFSAICLKLCWNCAFAQNLYTWKLGEIMIFYAECNTEKSAKEELVIFITLKKLNRFSGEIRTTSKVYSPLHRFFWFSSNVQKKRCQMQKMHKISWITALVQVSNYKKSCTFLNNHLKISKSKIFAFKAERIFFIGSRIDQQ